MFFFCRVIYIVVRSWRYHYYVFIKLSDWMKSKNIGFSLTFAVRKSDKRSRNFHFDSRPMLNHLSTKSSVAQTVFENVLFYVGQWAHIFFRCCCCTYIPFLWIFRSNACTVERMTKVYVWNTIVIDGVLVTCCYFVFSMLHLASCSLLGLGRVSKLQILWTGKTSFPVCFNIQ